MRKLPTIREREIRASGALGQAVLREIKGRGATVREIGREVGTSAASIQRAMQGKGMSLGLYLALQDWLALDDCDALANGRFQ